MIPCELRKKNKWLEITKKMQAGSGTLMGILTIYRETLFLLDSILLLTRVSSSSRFIHLSESLSSLTDRAAAAAGPAWQAQWAVLLP